MIFSEMQTEVFGLLGKFSALDPASDTENRIKRWLNTGYQKILLWKLENDRQLRFRCTEGELFFKTALVTGTAEAGSTTTITLQLGAVGATADQYNGWIVEITGGTGSGQKRLIVDYDSSRVATVNESWLTTPDSTSTYKLYKRFMRFIASGGTGASDNITIDPVSSLYHVLKVTDLKDKKDLEPADRTDNWPGVLLTASTPTEYLTYGDALMFDCPIAEERWYRLEYFRMPPVLSADGDEPEMPEVWQEAIVQWATWRGLKYTQEPSLAYAAKMDLRDYIEGLVTQEAVEGEREDAYVYVDKG